MGIWSYSSVKGAETLRLLPPFLKSLCDSRARRDLSRRFQSFSCSSKTFYAGGKSWLDQRKIDLRWTAIVNASGDLASLPELDESPVAVELELVGSEIQFDRILAEAQQLKEPVIIVWMASWCRKCIYLKPKLEMLAADYYPRLRFYYVTVNTVPYRFVARAEVTKMPTIQLWIDGTKEAEVIGVHKAYMVVNEVREMIENQSNSLGECLIH